MVNGVRHFVCLLLVWASMSTAQADVSREILNITERLFVDSTATTIAGVATIRQPSYINELYQQSGHQPVWDEAELPELLALLRSSEEDGLNPSDYHYNELLALQAEVGESWSDPELLRAQMDVLLSDGLLLFARHLVQGKIDPRRLDATWNYSRQEYEASDVAARLLAAASRDDVTGLIRGLAPDTDFYRQMKVSLDYYRELADQEQFFLIPADTVLKPGQNHPNVVLLRRRMKQLSYLPPDSPETEYFDEQLADAIRLFQRDHGIDSDGIVGRQSYQVLNITFQQRVDQLRVNMDRLFVVAVAVESVVTSDDGKIPPGLLLLLRKMSFISASL